MKKILLLLFSLLIFAFPAHARSLYWERIDVEMRVNSDSTVDVTEKQEYVFSGAWNGGYRDLRLKGFDQVSDITWVLRPRHF